MKLSHTLSLALGLALAPALATANTGSSTGTAIYQAPIGPQSANKSSTFVVNPELGRAWVEITKHYNFSDSPAEVVRVTVPGLSFDAGRGAVVFETEGREVQCATVREAGRWLFKSQVVEPTGQCELTQRYTEVPVDDGFAVERIEHFEVHFKPAS